MERDQTSNAKYPLVNGQHKFSDGSYVEVTNGNHVHIEAVSQGPKYVNISNIMQNERVVSDPNSINYKPLLFTIPNGSEAVFDIKNTFGKGIWSGETNFKLASSNMSSVFRTGVFNAGKPQNNTHVEVVTDTEINVGCLFVYTVMNNASIDFDVQFIINGERWISP